MVVWSEGPLTPRKYKPIFFVRCKSCRGIPCPAGTKVFDGASNRSLSTCLKTPQSGFLEEAEAVPAESNGPQRKTPKRTRRNLSDLVKTITLFNGGAQAQAQSQRNICENSLCNMLF